MLAPTTSPFLFFLIITTKSNCAAYFPSGRAFSRIKNSRGIEFQHAKTLANSRNCTRTYSIYIRCAAINFLEQKSVPIYFTTSGIGKFQITQTTRGQDRFASRLKSGESNSIVAVVVLVKGIGEKKERESEREETETERESSFYRMARITVVATTVQAEAALMKQMHTDARYMQLSRRYAYRSFGTKTNSRAKRACLSRHSIYQSYRLFTDMTRS